MFQYFITPESEPAPTCQPALTPEHQPILPTEECDDRQKVASWLYGEEDDDMESILDPNHPVQAQMEDEGWNQLRDGELVQNKGVAPYVDHEDRVWKPVTRDQKRIMKAKSRAEKRHHKLNSQRKLIPSALRLPKQSAPLPVVSKQSAILPAPAVSREPMPTEKPTLLPPMFNIMGGKGSRKSENFSKKSQGGKMSKSLRAKTLNGGKNTPEGEGAGYDIKQSTTGSINKSPKKAPTTMKLKEAQSIYRQSSKTSKPSLMQRLTGGGGGKTPLENNGR